MLPKNVRYYDSVAYESGEVVKASPGVLHRISGFNAHVAAVFIQLHDAAAMPANNAVPAIIIHVAATSAFDFDLSELGRNCQKGISICSSSAGPTKTLSGNTAWFSIQFT